jgi:hypothetical protein
MYATVRRYPGAAALGDTMAAKANDVEQIIRDVPGFLAYFAIRDGDDITSVTVCDSSAGTDESTRRAREWVKENVQGKIGAPSITEGNVFISFSK